MMTAEQSAIGQFRKHDTDTGSPQVQVVRLTERINDLTEHFKSHKKDHSSRRGLLRMVNRRRSLLEYIKRHDEQTYRELLQSLNLRK